MHRWRLIALGIAGWLWSGAGNAEPVLRIASDDWCPYVCASSNGTKLASGFLVDLTAQAMALSGGRVEPVLLPLNRALRMTLNGEIDGMYAPAIDKRLYLSAAMIHSHACFYTRKVSTWRYTGLDSLQGKSLGLIADYGYDNGPMDNYLANLKKGHHDFEFNVGEDAGVKNVRKLLIGRYDIILEHEVVVARLLEMLNEQNSVRQSGCLEQALPLVVGISARRSDAHALIHRIDDGVARLKASGEYAKLLQRYKIVSHDATVKAK